MIRVLMARIRQKHRTMKFPAGNPPPLPEAYRGRIELSPDKCTPACAKCAGVCPTAAVSADTSATNNRVTVDLGKCLFCGQCESACPARAIAHARDYRLAARRREDLVTTGNEFALAKSLEGEMRRLLGRSLKLRQVSAGGCNACEADVNVLGTVGWDLGRFGIQFVASPRHADGLLITGPVTQNMQLALKKTYDAVPRPKIVIAVGACAISGGPFAGSAPAGQGADTHVPVDLYIPGCPPHPLTILDGLLRLIGRL